MKTASLREQLTEAEATVRACKTNWPKNRGLVALSMELEQASTSGRRNWPKAMRRCVRRSPSGKGLERC